MLNLSIENYELGRLIELISYLVVHCLLKTIFESVIGVKPPTRTVFVMMAPPRGSLMKRRQERLRDQ